ncbi:MAG TPA: DUF1849 family protein [Rhodospirillales bacterium]|nr:DUF1849 family protein [Rhodospirillales bacterium]
MEQRSIVDPLGALRRAALCLALVFIALATLSVARAAKMVSHRAFYTLSSGGFKSGGRFTGVDGTMELALEKDCTGWTMSQSLRMNLQMANGSELRQVHRYTGRESDDGIRYDFYSSSQIGNSREDFRGRAIMESSGGPGNAVFRIPQGKKIPLPLGTKFLFAHTIYLIEQAEAGARLATAIVFDGTDDEGPQEVTAFIARKRHAREFIGKDRVKALGPLVDRSGWKIRMAFYKLDSRGAVPEYEVEALQLDNGVTPWLLLDYQDFSVVLELDKLEEISSPQC